MKDIKKIILTLALLITAVTGAWADQLASSYSSNATLNAVTVSASMEVTIATGVTVTINNGLNITSGTLTVKGPGTLVVNGKAGSNGQSDDVGGNGTPGGVAISGNIIVQDGATVQANGGKGGNGGYGEPENGGHGANGAAAISGNVTVQGGATVKATGGNGGNGGNSEIETGGNGGNGGNAFAGTLTYKGGTVTADGGAGGSGGSGDEGNGSSGSAGKAFTNDVDFTQTTGYSVTNGTSTIGSVLNQTKVVISGGTEPAAPSGPEVAWDKATKTGTFTMPGGNVTLEPDYYPQATAAEGAVTAADADARATTDDPLVKVDATKLTGAKKLMYFVSNSGTTAPAYDAEGWTDQLPTAEGITQQGIVYVWYYPVGTDEGVDGATATYSDGDICLQSITARIAAEPTYAVTFADDLAEPDKWTASPAADVKKGQTVTVTYTGTKKVIGVKAEKKAAAPATALAPALENGATVVIAFNYGGANTCTFTNNNGTFTLTSGTGSIGGNGNSAKQLTIENGNIVFKANYYSPIDNDWDSAGFQVTFDPTANSYAVWKSGIANSNGGAFTSITVNGTDVTSQLSELK